MPWSFFYIPSTASPHPPLTLTPPLPRRSIGPAITGGKSFSAETISDWEDWSSHESVFISDHAEFLGKFFISRMIFKASSGSYIFTIAICKRACSGGKDRAGGCPGGPDPCPFSIQSKLCPQILKPIYKKRFEKSEESSKIKKNERIKQNDVPTAFFWSLSSFFKKYTKT